MVFNVNGETVQSVYAVNGEYAYQGFDISGNVVFDNGYLPNRFLVFEDDFDENALDENVWSYDLRSMSEGDLQYYRRENVSIQDSCLVITAKKEASLSNAWTSGRINTAGKNGWRFGRFEAKIKFPDVVGSLPAFWLMGFNLKTPPDPNATSIKRKYMGSVDWPNCGELDIVEAIPGNTKRPISTVWPAKDYTASFEHLYQTSPNSDISLSQWHMYGVEIEAEYITFYIDGVQIGRMNLQNYPQEYVNAYSKPMQIILNLAIGHGTPTAEEMKMYVDWVRVYAPPSVLSPILADSISLPSSITIKPEANEYEPFKYFVYPTFVPDNVTDRSVTWSTSNNNVVTCEAGVITAHANGTATVTASTKNGKTAQVSVTVTGLT